jgi:heat shock protein HslJ
MSFASRLYRSGRRYTGCLAAAAALAALAACSTPMQPELAQARYQPAYASDFLAQTNWVLARWTRAGGTLRPVPRNDGRDRPITMGFSHEATQLRVAGFAGCNSYSSNYTVANGNLIVTAPPVATRMACQPAERMQTEQDFLAALTSIRATSVDDMNNPRRLSLSLNNGEVLDFARADMGH